MKFMPQWICRLAMDGSGRDPLSPAFDSNNIINQTNYEILHYQFHQHVQ